MMWNGDQDCFPPDEMLFRLRCIEMTDSRVIKWEMGLSRRDVMETFSMRNNSRRLAASDLTQVAPKFKLGRFTEAQIPRAFLKGPVTQDPRSEKHSLSC